MGDVDDVHAEVWLVAWQHARQLPDGEQLRWWLLGVARRQLATAHRKTASRSRLFDRLRGENGNQFAADVADRVSTDAQLSQALRRMKAGDVEVLTLSGWDGLGPEGIAAVLGISTNAATIRLHRARKKLEEAMKEQDTETHSVRETR